MKNAVIDFSKAKDSLVDQQLDLINEINKLIKDSPLGNSIQLVLSSQNLQINDDEILVQEVDVENRQMLLVPKKIKQLEISDITHETHIIKINDTNSKEFLDTAVAAKCLKRNGLNGKVHIYD